LNKHHSILGKLTLVVSFLVPGAPVLAQAPPAKEQAFEVATIKPATPGDRSGKFATMQGGHQFVVRNYRLRDLVSFAYDLPPRMVFGGPSWTDIDSYNILAATPGEARPNLAEQMAMVRKLLDERFSLKIHTEPKEFPVYALTVAKGGIKFTASAAKNAQPVLVNVMFPDRAHLPARNATMGQFASMLQRGVLDRPVVDSTNLTAMYDFDLEWAWDDSQFGGNLPPVSQNSTKPDLFAALQEQLGLRLESSRAQIDTVVIDSVQKATEN
jgi:uncharacterized protein (TIGR03435 family)